MNNDTFSELLENLAATSESAKKWFWETSTKKPRKDYEARGKLGDKGTGSVYVYIGDKGRVIYVGETGRKIKDRQHDVKSPHKKQKWWNEWNEVRFLHVSDRTERITLELFLILQLNPRENTKPGYREIAKMYRT